jgi:hypothetical protein
MIMLAIVSAIKQLGSSSASGFCQLFRKIDRG